MFYIGLTNFSIKMKITKDTDAFDIPEIKSGAVFCIKLLIFFILNINCSVYIVIILVFRHYKW